jgi:hypothetical protein
MRCIQALGQFPQAQRLVGKGAQREWVRVALMLVEKFE